MITPWDSRVRALAVDENRVAQKARRLESYGQDVAARTSEKERESRQRLSVFGARNTWA